MQDTRFRGRALLLRWPPPLMLCSSARLEQTPDTRKVNGSNPFRATTHASLAQQAEQLPCKQKVRGSIPRTGTNNEDSSLEA